VLALADTMADFSLFLLSDLLCFLVNKYNKVPLKSIKSIIMDFYSSKDIADSKSLLIKEFEKLGVKNPPRITRSHRDSMASGSMDLDDIVSIITYLDENQLLKSIPAFVSSSPDNMPSVRLAEGDLDFLLKKLSTMEDLLNVQDIKFKSFLEYVNFAKENFLQLTTGLSSLKKVIDTALGVQHEPGALFNARQYVQAADRPYSSIVSNDYESGLSQNNSARVSSVSKELPDQAERGNSYVNSTSWATAALVNSRSDGETESDSNVPFNVVISKSAKRLQKRLPSPLESTKIKRNQIYSATENRAVLNSRQGESSSRVIVRAAPSRIIGTGKATKLRAADPRPPVRKSVFCISNLSINCSVSDIKEHCRSNNIRVLFCFDVSKSVYQAKAFKLAVPESESNLVLDVATWPDAVSIRLWNHATSNNPSSAGVPCMVSSQSSYSYSGASVSDPVSSHLLNRPVSHDDSSNSVLNSTVIETASTPVLEARTSNSSVHECESVTDAPHEMSCEETISTQPDGFVPSCESNSKEDANSYSNNG
jgi:hypothetical protein